MAAKAKDIDWSAVEADYRAGIKTLRDIAAAHGPSPAGILKRAKRDGWARDLSAAIKARAEEKVNKAAVNRKVNKAVDEKAVVEANSDLQASALLGHRRDIVSLKRTIVGLADELGALTNTELQDALHGLMEEDVAETDSETRKSALRKAYHAAMALGGRAGAGQKLAAALGTLIDKERQALGIDKSGAREDGLLNFLKGLDAPQHAA